MTADAAVLVRSFRVGKRTCTVTIPRPQQRVALCAVTEWSPTVPKRLTKRELREYRMGRDAAYAELAAALGVKAMVVEI